MQNSQASSCTGRYSTFGIYQWQVAPSNSSVRRSRGCTAPEAACKNGVFIVLPYVHFTWLYKTLSFHLRLETLMAILKKIRSSKEIASLGECNCLPLYMPALGLRILLFPHDLGNYQTYRTKCFDAAAAESNICPNRHVLRVFVCICMSKIKARKIITHTYTQTERYLVSTIIYLYLSDIIWWLMISMRDNCAI